MPGKILHRCDLCGNFHATYLVDDPKSGGKIRLCYNCWKAKYACPPRSASDISTDHAKDQAKTRSSSDHPG